MDYDHTWTPQAALLKQVEKEDIWAWAKKEDAPFQVIPPMKVEKWSLAPVVGFIRSVIC